MMWMRLVALSLVVFLGGCWEIPSDGDATPDPVTTYLDVTIHLGHIPDGGDPWAPTGGLVTYSWASAPESFTVRGVWPTEMVIADTPTGVEFVSGYSHDGLTTYDLGAVAGIPCELAIPYSLADHVITGRADGAYTTGGYFYSPDEGLSYTVTWPDFCGSVWPCPDDDYARVVWDVVPPDYSTGLWLAEDSRDTATDPFHVAWAWYKDGRKIDLGGGLVVVGRTSLLPAIEDALVSRELYLSTADALLGGRPYTGYGLVDAGDWGVAPSYGAMGGMEHTPYAFVDSRQGVAYKSLPEHEYLHAWFSAAIGYPHIGEMIVGEGPATYLEGVVRAEAGGGPQYLQEWVAYLCEWAADASTAATYPAWAPLADDVDPPLIYGPGLPYAAGALALYDFSSHELGDPAALAPVLGDIVRDLPPGAYSFGDLVDEIEFRTGAEMDMYMPWVTQTEISTAAEACDVLP